MVAVNVVLHEKPSGTPGTSIYAGKIDDWLDENTKTRGDNWYGAPNKVGESQKMLADPHCRRARDGITDAILAAYWDFEPGEDSPLGIEVADFAKHAFFEVLAWTKSLQNIVNGYLQDGVHVVEKTEGVKRISKTRFPLHPGKGQAILYTGFYDRPTWSIYEWNQSTQDATQLASIKQYTMGSDGETAGFKTIDAKHLIRFTWEQVGANFEGYPVFRSAWGPWFAKRVLTRIELISHEKNHVSQPHVELPNETSIEQAQDDLDNLATSLAESRAHQQGFLIIPPGYQVNYKSGQASTNIAGTIERLNFDIAHAFGSAFMVMGRKASGASYALADTQEGQYNLSLDKHAKFIELCFNHGLDGWSPVQWLIELNYGPDAPMPKLVARNLPTVNWASILPVLFQGIEKNAIKVDASLEAFIRRVTQAPKADKVDEKAAKTNVVYSGIQVTSAKDIILDAAYGRLPRETVQAMLSQFFGINPKDSDRMLASVGQGFVPVPEAAKEPMAKATDEPAKPEDKADKETKEVEGDK